MFLKNHTKPLWILGTRIRDDILITDFPKNKGKDYYFHRLVLLRRMHYCEQNTRCELPKSAVIDQ
jgi:hypothetical protein